MNRPSWFPGNGEKLRLSAVPDAAAAPPAKVPGGGRSIRERLQATLRQQGEGLSPRALRRTLAELQSIIDPHVSEVEGGRRAQDMIGRAHV